MTKEQIDKLVLNGEFNRNNVKTELIETHISWVVLCDRYAFKIKRPIHYSFLDFSTPEKRKYYCEREVALNNRLAKNIYIDVQPVREKEGQYYLGGITGEIVDYAVRMHRLDSKKQMDLLLLSNSVTHEDIWKLAQKIADFHKNTTIIYQKDFLDVQQKFIDLEAETDFLEQHIKKDTSKIINHAIDMSNAFMDTHKNQLALRLKAGFFRDCHGDLHSRNIFLLPAPQAFDCIEFNDDLRQIDVLNEVAFLCMDLDSFGRQDLSDLFLRYYNDLFPTMKSTEDKLLFVYYKSYRSNIRAKVNSLRARSAKDETEKANALSESAKYLQLMSSYIQQLGGTQ
jgi:aminoglycoside phosphotransferase family enzyme